MIAWGAASISLLLSGFSLYLLSLFGLMLFQFESFTQLRIAVSGAQADLAQAYLSRLVMPPRFLHWGWDFAVKTQEMNEHAAIIKLLPSLSTQNCAQALQIGAELNFEKLGLIKVREQLISCSLAAKSAEQGENDLSQLQRYLRNYPQQYQELAERFAALLSLQAARDTNGQIELIPYQAGVLSGLPRLQGLRDSITTLAELKAELVALKAEVKISAANPFEEFGKRLQEFINETSALNTERSRGLNRVEELKAEIKDLRTKQQRLVRAILSDFAQILAGDPKRFLTPKTLELKELLDKAALTV